MGFKMKRIEGIKLAPNEEKEIEITLEKEMRAAIHGVVKLPGGAPAKNALVKLFKKVESGGKCDLIPVTFQYTDECGQFLFGVDSCHEFVIKIFFFIPEKICKEKEQPCDY